MGNSNGTYTLTYDALNRVTVVKGMWGKYDAANNLVTRLYSASGANPLRIDLTYNAVNQIETEKPYAAMTHMSEIMAASGM
jgi:hypothetical protein